jgi:hypothetical protein
MRIQGTISLAVAQGYDQRLATQDDSTIVTAPVQQLVAAQVAERVNFDRVDTASDQPLQLYTRTADCIEAATRIATGQRLNIEA